MTNQTQPISSTSQTPNQTPLLFAFDEHNHRGHFDVCPHCHRSLYKGGCRRRTCPAQAVHYLRDLSRCVRDNLGGWDGQIAMLTLTAPGARVLPWDEKVCAGRGEHKHSGPAGCRCKRWEAADWNLTVERRLRALTKGAHRAVRESGCGGRVTVLARVDERQARGLFHPHIALGIQTAADRVALDVFCAYVKANRGKQGFGPDRHGYDVTPPDKYPPGHAAAYLAKYVRPDRAKQSFVPLLRDVEVVAVLNRLTGRRQVVRPVYVSRVLTARSRVTMRHLRVRRYVFRLWPAASPGEIKFAAEVLCVFDGSYPDHPTVLPRPPTAKAIAAARVAAAALEEKEMRVRPAALAAQLPGGAWDHYRASNRWR